MEETEYNEFNSIVAMAVEQQLLLWQTTHSLLEIDKRLNKHLRSEKDHEQFSEKDLSLVGSILRSIRKLFNRSNS